MALYFVFLLGFGGALAALNEIRTEDSKGSNHSTSGRGVEIELSRMTLGLGDTGINGHAKYPVLSLLLLISYVVLTVGLLPYMLIALMGETVGDISMESERVWTLQRARTTVETEKRLPKFLRKKFQLGEWCKVADNDTRLCLRIQGFGWPIPT